MTPEEIQAKLNKHGITRYQLAKDYELSESHLSHIFSGNRKLNGFKKAFFKLLVKELDRQEK